MKGTPFTQFSTEVLRRGAAAVLPQHLPDRWLDALLEEADLLAPGEDDHGDDCCAGLLGAVLVLVSAQRGDPPALEIAGTTLLEYLHCYIMALSAESVSRRTDIWVEPPTLANIFDAERAVRARRRGPAGPSPRPRHPPRRTEGPSDAWSPKTLRGPGPPGAREGYGMIPAEVVAHGRLGLAHSVGHLCAFWSTPRHAVAD
jgi:hypothetical protein